MTNSAMSVFVVDDDASVLRALRRALAGAGLNAVTFDSARAFLDAIDANAEGCVLLDVAMPDMNGLELQDALAARECTLPIIFLTGHGDIPMSVQAMKHGAVDFLTKPVDYDLLLAAIDNAFQTNRLALQERAQRAEVDRRLALLTAREREVLTHLIGGKLNKQVAADLGTVEKTIKVHRSRIMHKMQVRSLAELVRMIEQAGIKLEAPSGRPPS